MSHDPSDEVWKRIDFTDRHYEVSNWGRVKSFYHNKEKGELIKGRLSNEYRALDLRVDGKRKSYYIHKLVAAIFCEQPSNKHKIVIHLDNDKHNNRADNLKWVTTKEAFEHQLSHSEKMQEGFVENTTANAKLSIEDVSHIRKMLRRGVPQNKIAYMFCVSEMQITRIKRNENWASVRAAVPEEENDEVDS